ncbi:tetratricopeptide repeat protein [Salinactinospora qingdaonensis]|uniref:XRE family transcriptional regulator n=1 Tax=Salinactinospora qingdaonensis TaxID=702744 RepID=A0ABP7FAH2_9ACTN
MADGSSDPSARSADAEGTHGGAGMQNRLAGNIGAAVQAGEIHGGVNITAAPAKRAPVPRQLPLAASGFVNRRAELDRLDALLASTADGRTQGAAAAVVISAIGGAPGIGKTALALHWAHRVRARFVDGDLYVNLHGHGPGPRLDAAAALDSLLRTLDVPPDRIPLDLDGKAGLFRSRVNGKRMLLLVDDALSVEQVRPLLPASPTCLVLITSRSTLPGLAAREGARKMTLETLSVEESLVLLREHLGASRVDAEPEAARKLVDQCARLPLALRILAERLNELPETALGTVMADLSAEDARLDELGVTGDELSDVRAVFSASYGALSAEAARLFRTLGTYPGTEFGPTACAAAVALPVSRTRRLLEHLAGASLLQRLGEGRYRLHDLLRVYAVERFRAEEPAGQEAVVLGRLGAWYVVSARNAVRAVLPNFRFVAFDGGEYGEPAVFESATAALTWFARERATIVQTIRALPKQGLDDLAWRLPATVYPLFEYTWHWVEWRDIHLTGLEAARTLDDRHGQARNLLGLADAEWSMGNGATAVEHYDAALTTAREAGDDWTEGFALRQLGTLRWNRGGDEQAQVLLQEAAAVFRRAEERRGEGMALLSLADCERDQGRFEAALERARAAIALFIDISDTWTVAWARCCLAAILTAAGRYETAVAEYKTAIAVFSEMHNLEGEAVARMGLGRAHAAAEHNEAARSQLGAALDILRSMADPRADEVAAEIARLT